MSRLKRSEKGTFLCHLQLRFTEMGKDNMAGSLIQRCQDFPERVKSDQMIWQWDLLEISKHLLMNSNHHTEHKLFVDQEW